MARKSLNDQVRDLLAIGTPNGKCEKKPNKHYNPKPIAPPLLPSAALILRTYNKYRKGYEYTKEVWELRDLVLPLAVAYYVNSVHFERLFECMTYKDGCDTEANVKNYKFWEEREDRFLNGCNGLCTGSEELLPIIKEAVKKLHQAKTDFDILCAVDRVFNIMHDDGSIAKYMVTINGKPCRDTTWENKFEAFIATLSTLRDW